MDSDVRYCPIDLCNIALFCARRFVYVYFAKAAQIHTIHTIVNYYIDMVMYTGHHG